VAVLMVQLRVYKVEQHLQHVQLATAAMVTAAQDLQAAQAVTQSAAMAVPAVTYLAAPVLMQHLHVKPQIAALTTTVLLPSQSAKQQQKRKNVTNSLSFLFLYFLSEVSSNYLLHFITNAHKIFNIIGDMKNSSLMTKFSIL
jgi:hypothetical protein